MLIPGENLDLIGSLEVSEKSFLLKFEKEPTGRRGCRGELTEPTGGIDGWLPRSGRDLPKSSPEWLLVGGFKFF